MLFNSFEFLIFFILTSVGYFVINHQYRWAVLLLASCIFYMYFIPIYILILFLTIIIDYFAGILLENTEGKKRKWYLVASIVTNIGILAFFKYFNFFIDNLNGISGVLGSPQTFKYLPIILPIGLSFHTFQAMSYTIEVYRGNQKAERHFGIYSLYVMFYPQLVAGPIERPQNMLHQFHEEHHFNFDNLLSGLRWLLWGLFKKVVIADRLAIMVDYIYNGSGHSSGMEWIIATILFAIQIYCDFSGYSDMALGSARIMGFDLMLNFRQPYFSKNIAEFWSRWHISLSTWFKDYLYIPLGGNRVKISRWKFNLFFVFMVSGFWHGANWTFIIWGALHGVYLIVAEIRKRFFKQIIGFDFLNILITFILVSFAWIFFRANSLEQAFNICKEIFKPIDASYFQISKSDLHGQPDTILGLAKWKFIASLMVIPILFYCDYLISTKKVNDLIKKSPIYSWSIYYMLIIIILLFGVFDTKQFIYFQF
jgi:D-alanyl-lipoteichoic acid acyltransferase DltB (MBOAT superfamily)